MRRNQEGFTLPEILIGLAISSIIIAASFASYIVIKQNYDFQKDMKNISQTSRAVATMIMRDVRMAGYNYDDGPAKQKPEILNPIKITDGTTTGPDRIEIIYDKSYTERLKISYYTKPYNNRLRAYKKVEKCNAMNCATSSLQTVIAESPIADYVEDLQFTGYKNGSALGTGDIIYGQGNVRVITPIKGTVISPLNSCVKNTLFVFDGRRSTYWRCGDEGGSISSQNNFWIRYEFDKPIRLISATSRNIADLKGGSFTNTWPGHGGGITYSGAVSPWGLYHMLDLQLTFRLSDGVARTCVYAKTQPSKCGSSSQMGYFPDVGGTGFLLTNIDQTWLTTTKANFSGGDEFTHWASKFLDVRTTGYKTCDYTSGQCVSGNNLSGQIIEVPDISITAEVYGEAQSPQEVEIGLLIRSPEEHGTSPVSQTFTIGNWVINKNDNYIRDSFTISALVRNLYYAL